MAFDLPTQMGRDPDHALARGEVGRVGVSISSLEDMRLLLDGLPLGEVSTSMTINSTASTLLALYVAVADERGVPRSSLSGTIQNDILKEYTVVEEAAFTICNGIAYVDAAVQAGLSVDEFAGRLSFFFNSHNVLIEEVAKFRAARRLWARIMRERFSAKDPKSWQLRFHAQTAGSSLQAQQPLVNVVRTAVQALAAVLGGAQSLHTNSFDEALALPTESSARLALRTQQVLAHESGLGDLIDPLGGAYAVEAMTREIEQRAEEYIQKIDELGGMVAAIEQAYPQRAIEQRAYEYQRAIEKKTKVIVGVNEFVVDEAPPEGLHKLDPELEKAQAERVRRVRSERDKQAASEALSALERAARGTENLLPHILSSVKARATVGEISDALRAVFGQHLDSGH